jgi:hypothetical protein
MRTRVIRYSSSARLFSRALYVFVIIYIFAVAVKLVHTGDDGVKRR